MVFFFGVFWILVLLRPHLALVIGNVSVTAGVFLFNVHCNIVFQQTVPPLQPGVFVFKDAPYKKCTAFPQSSTKDIKSTSFDCCRKGVASFNGRGHWPKRFFFSKNVYVNNSVSVRISLKVWYTNWSVSPKPSFVWLKKKKKVYTLSAYLQLPAVQTPLSSPISFQALPVNSELHMTAVANQRLQRSHDVTSTRAVIAEASDWLPFWEGGDRRQLQRR